MADKDMQSSLSFSQSAAGGVMAGAVKFAVVREHNYADVDSHYYVFSLLCPQSWLNNLFSILKVV